MGDAAANVYQLIAVNQAKAAILGERPYKPFNGGGMRKIYDLPSSWEIHIFA